MPWGTSPRVGGLGGRSLGWRKGLAVLETALQTLPILGGSSHGLFPLACSWTGCEGPGNRTRALFPGPQGQLSQTGTGLESGQLPCAPSLLSKGYGCRLLNLATGSGAGKEGWCRVTAGPAEALGSVGGGGGGLLHLLMDNVQCSPRYRILRGSEPSPYTELTHSGIHLHPHLSHVVSRELSTTHFAQTGCQLGPASSPYPGALGWESRRRRRRRRRAFRLAQLSLALGRRR